MKGLICFLLLISALNGNAQQVIPLFDKIPNNINAVDIERELAGGKMVSQVVKPTLTIFLPAKEIASHMAIIICPGGGYTMLSMTNEGYSIAAKLNEMGIAAFVLKYRIPIDSMMTNKEICPLQDAQRALQLVRENAVQYNIDTAMVGIMGFSAGGHLAATASTHFQKYYIPNKEKINLRPDFSVLIYPVISFSDKLTHLGSRVNLIGKSPSAELIHDFSNELFVNNNTPPAFLVHAQDDRMVNPLNSLVYFEALLSDKIPNCEMHIYPKGGHGFGMNIPKSDVYWMDQLQNWLSVINKTQKTNKSN